MSNFDQLAFEVSKLLLDSNDCGDGPNFVRWSKNDLIHYAKDAIIMISLLKPDWFSELKVMTAQPGRVQTVPEGCDKLLKVIGVHGSVDADSPIASTVNERLGGIFPSNCTQALTAKDYKLSGYTIEGASKNIFYVEPPVPADGEVKLDIICTSSPDTSDKDYVIPNWMHNLAVEWMMYRAYLSEEESSGAEAAAQLHLQHFYAMIGNISQADDIVSGKVGMRRNATAETN